MSFTPSIGDILMLSELAWRIGCAFTAGRQGAPSQFAEVESELKGLAKALILLGETLDKDGSILERADEKAQTALCRILDGCKQSLGDLQAKVDNYQVIQKDDISGATERTWRGVLLRNWKTISWTREGGSVQSLRNMLAMHTQSISLAMQALQSGSLARIERIIEPVADKIDNIHDRFNGDLDVKIDELHQVMLSLKASIDNSPSIRAGDIFDPPPPFPNSPTAAAATYKRDPSPSDAARRYQQRVPTTTLTPLTPQRTPELPSAEFHSFSSLRIRDNRSSRGSESDHQLSGSPVISSGLNEVLSRVGESSSPPSRPGTRQGVQRVSTSGERSTSAGSQSGGLGPTPPGARQTSISFSMPYLPPAMLDIDSAAAAAPDRHLEDPARSSSWAGSTTSEQKRGSRISNMDDEEYALVSTPEERAAFERSLFTNSAVLCDLRGTLVEYTQPDEEQNDMKMEKACDGCRICIVRKAQRTSVQGGGGMRSSTSIWVLSDDGAVRVQQKIPEDENVIPYTIWGNETKVVLRIHAELRYHGIVHDSRPIKTAKSSWINYVFANEQYSANFQSVIMNQPLLFTIKSKGTTRLHEGFAGAFAYSDQLCGLENLRIFYNEHTGIATVWIHYHPESHDGYMVFPLNNPRLPIRVREEEDTKIRVKGLNTAVSGTRVKRSLSTSDKAGGSASGGGGGGKQKQEKPITGVRIEFCTAKDKTRFLDRMRQIQDDTFLQRGGSLGSS